MSKSIRNENTGRHAYKARINELRGFKPMPRSARNREALREQAFVAANRASR